MTSANKHLEILQRRWLDADPTVAATSANMLQDVIHSIFGNAAQIGYELLQNADDAAKGEGLCVDVEYIILQDHLIVQHNGGHFSSQDVEGICRYGAVQEGQKISQEAKQYNLKKIGYKGIGFKSVFNLSDQVWIRSTPYTFKFDKFHWGETSIPWQLIPIPLEEEKLPLEVMQSLKEDWVSFILAFKSKDTQLTKKAIAHLFDKEEVILFLRHIRSAKMLVQYPDGEIKVYRHLLRTQNDKVFNLKRWKNEELKGDSNWYISKFSFPIPEDIRASLTPLNKQQCPEKLKSAKETEISFGAKIGSDSSIIPLAKPNLFSFLPTKTKYEFPFLVNGNFLLNEAREKLLDVPWNEFLFEKIGFYQLQWFKQMATDERFRYEFAGLLVRYADTTKEERNKSLNRGVMKASQQISFVPVLDRKELERVSNTIVDQTGISTGLNDQDLVKESFSKELFIADPNIKKINKLISIGAEQFDQEKLREAIRQTNRYRKPEDNIRLVDFFYQRINALNTPTERGEWNKVLHETSFLLDDEQNLLCPGELYYPTEVLSIPFELTIRFLDSAVYQHVHQNIKQEKWLMHLGLAHPKPIEIIRRGIFPLLEDDNLAATINISVTRYIFQHSQQLQESDFKVIRNLSVFTKNESTVKVSTAYLSNEYEPKLPLEDLLDENIFISPNYMKEDDNPMDWNRFFEKLGAKQEMIVELHNIRAPLNKLQGEYPNYYTFLKPLLPDFSKTARHDLVNFVTPGYIQYCDHYDFALQYWTIILQEKWKEVQRKCRSCVFQHSNGKSNIPSYFEFIARSKPYFPAQDGSCYPTKEVFSQSLALLLTDNYPISAIEMTREQEEFWGIQNELELTTCLELLEAMENDDSSIHKERISQLYQYICNRRFELDAFEKQKTRIEDLKLLATDNTFQPITRLHYLMVPWFATKANSANFLFMELPDQDAKKFCTQLRIKVIALNDLSVSIQPVVDNHDFSSYWGDRIPLISALSAYRKGSPLSQELQRLFDLTEKTDLICTKRISLELVFEERIIYQKSVKAWQEEEKIYFVQTWRDAQNRFDLAAVLAEYFNLGDMERELDLLLTLPVEKGLVWLQENGIEVVINPKSDKKEIELGDIQEKASSPVKVPVEESRLVENTIFEPSSKKYQPISQEGAEEIGYWGEDYIFQKKIIAEYYEEQKIHISQLKWVNQEGESHLPYDFIVTLQSKEKEYWEIKSTPSSNKISFPISEQELQLAIHEREKYYLIRIQNAGRANPNLKIYCNPAAFIETGKIKITGAELKLLE
jgi:hypothetical protein